MRILKKLFQCMKYDFLEGVLWLIAGIGGNWSSVLGRNVLVCVGMAALCDNGVVHDKKEGCTRKRMAQLSVAQIIKIWN